jgi:uncharacterized protein
MLSLPTYPPDRVAVLLVEGLFQAKFFLLFSFIFGWGMEIQTLSAQRVGASFARRFSRRLMMLALFGALHAVLVFNGDILVLYALLGLAAWMLKETSIRNLMIIAAGLIPVAILCLALLAILLADFPLPTAGPTLGGNYAETVLARWRDWSETFVFLLLFQGHLALAAFLVGMAAARSGFFEPGNPGAVKLKSRVPMLLGLGLLVNGAMCWAVWGAKSILFSTYWAFAVWLWVGRFSRPPIWAWLCTSPKSYSCLIGGGWPGAIH